MELARNVETSVDISAEADLIEYTYDGTIAKEVVIRANLGDVSKPIAGDGTYDLKVYLNDVLISPSSSVQVAAGIPRTILVSRPLPIEAGDVVKVTVIGRPGDTSIDTAVTIRDVTAMREEEVAGPGSVPVDHNYGGSHNLTCRTPSGAGVDGADIYAYNRSDYDAGRKSNAYVVGRAITGQDGSWLRPLMLSPGEYVLVAFKSGVLAPTAVNLTVS